VKSIAKFFIYCHLRYEKRGEGTSYWSRPTSNGTQKRGEGTSYWSRPTSNGTQISEKKYFQEKNICGVHFPSALLFIFIHKM
jgi:hypothetical protein